MEQHPGFMIQAPMGSGKTTFITQLKNTPHTILDGDEILQKLHIKNKNDYWYEEEYEQERQDILNAFDYYLQLGCWIFYSGNPFIIKTDLIILPDQELRWKRLQNRKGYKP